MITWLYLLLGFAVFGLLLWLAAWIERSQRRR
jgi:hypothetical protein